jgi:uncharacterized protein YbaP (TraB family)
MRSPLSAITRLKPAQLIVLALAPLALLLWLGWQLGETDIEPANVTARPALWKASKGNSQLWIFGTIHVVPKGEPWLSPAIAKAADESDRLFLEVTGLDAERKSRATFEKLGRGKDLPPIADRLSEGDVALYRDLQNRHGSAFGDLDPYDSWAAALLVNAAATSRLDLSAGQAGEAVLSARFGKATKPVLGLETIEQQLSLFDRLPEPDQRFLLSQSLVEAKTAPERFRLLHTAWATGDTDLLEREFVETLTHNPNLRAALVDGRNARWARTLNGAMRDRPGKALAAVGVGHLVGNGSLQTRLETRGWQVRRIQ